MLFINIYKCINIQNLQYVKGNIFLYISHIMDHQKNCGWNFNVVLQKHVKHTVGHLLFLFIRHIRTKKRKKITEF